MFASGLRLALALCATQSLAVDVAVRLDDAIGFAGGLVRSQQNTKNDDESVTLDPICDGSEGCGSGGTLKIPFNTRSYVQASYDDACTGVTFGERDYSCVDYERGKIVFSGMTLSYDVDLSADGCGCNAALYLVSMPQSNNASQCADYYCDANDVCGVSLHDADMSA